MMRALRSRPWTRSRIACVGAFLLLAGLGHGQDDARREFFEARIRPVLAESCYPCHNSSGKAKADVALDWREAIRKPSDFGAPVVPGDPGASLLLQVVRHELEGSEMPEGGPMLAAEVIEDLAAWIRDGAFDPRDAPPSPDELAEATSWRATLARRKRWWSLQPIAAPELPAGEAAHPIDRFVQHRLVDLGLEQASPADRRTLMRRLSFALTGLPPAPEAVAQYLADEGPAATERLIDRLLASPRYGERWARHWMDLVRYADSHGSEGDPLIPEVWRYRDYLIRAFNADVPYDQLVREHVAGDLLPAPRIDEELGLDESAIGSAHWRLVFHGFTPTDALDEKVRFTDDQINVFGKAFLGLTISCARCHDHKFDAISQADYYALAGVLGSGRPAMQDVNSPGRQRLHQDRLDALAEEVRAELAASWLELARAPLPEDSGVSAAEDPGPLATTDRLVGEGRSFAEAWARVSADWSDEQAAVAVDAGRASLQRWELADAASYAAWFPSGNGLGEAPSRAGAFALEPEGERVVTGIYPAGVYTHLCSSRHRGVLGSPRFPLESECEVWFRVVGGGRSMLRYVVQNYPRSGTVYPVEDVRQPGWYWHRLDMSYWVGDEVHLELATARDAPVEVRPEDRSWFGLREVVVREKGAGPPHERPREAWGAVHALASSAPPTSRAELVALYARAITEAVEAWRDDAATDAQALFLNACLREGLLPNTLERLPGLAPLVVAWRELEAQVPLPTRVPGLAEAESCDQPLYDRGDHKKPLEPVPRRFLEAIDARPYPPGASGRLELAADLLRPDNPLTARVAVNRIWQHLFGQGLVATPDNFGRLGALPSHPELLDYLATRFVERGWSTKDMIRFILTSRTGQLASDASPAAGALDPENRWLARAAVRRLDAEAIRDTLLAVSGALDLTMYGAGFPANGVTPRRSVYVLARRNSLDQLLAAFDVPVPFATTGRRATTNVPAQSLVLLNDPFVLGLAAEWGSSMAADARFESDRARVAHMFESALARLPEPTELDALIAYLDACAVELQAERARRGELDANIDRVHAGIEELLAPVRARLSSTAPAGPEPMAAWDFSESAKDTVGGLHGVLHGSAHIEDGALVLDGSGHVSTPRIGRDIGEKTLTCRVQLANDTQRGGGVVALQDLRGDVFDSIVFAERIQRRWVAGSDFFRRTSDFGGEDELLATSEPVHLAFAYDADGTIRGYRNGELYGAPQRRGPLVTYAADDCQLLFGLRHGAASAGRMLQGRLLEARFYDRALAPEEIAATAQGAGFLGRQQLLAALDEDVARQVESLEAELNELERERAELGNPSDEAEPLARVAHALFNLKEFIYLR